MQTDDLCGGLGGLSADREREPIPIVPKRPGIEPVAEGEGRDRLAASTEDLLPVDREDEAPPTRLAILLSRSESMVSAVFFELPSDRIGEQSRAGTATLFSPC